MKVTSTTNAPAAIGPYSQAIAVNGFLFASGQIPLDPATGEIVGTTIEEQAEQVFKNLGAILAAAGMTFDDVVKATVLLDNIGDFAAVNAIYAEFFGDAKPARSCVEVARLPKDGLVEIEFVAVK